MTQKKKETCRILSHMQIATDIFDLRVESSMAESAVPGQFAGLYVPNDAKLLPRPISICDADEEKGMLRFVYRVKDSIIGAQSGTAEIARLKAGDSIDILGLLGNGYDVQTVAGKKAVLMGGGIGVPPMLFLAKKLSLFHQTDSRSSDVYQANGEKKRTKEKSVGSMHPFDNKNLLMIMGYRNAEIFLADEFRRYGELRIATDDGSVGTHGTVIDALLADNRLLMNSKKVEEKIVFACGPLPMLRVVKEYVAEIGKEQSVKAYISLEERMACGVGVCLGCVTKTVHTDTHSGVHNARICTEGPVFDADSVVL